MKLNTVKSIASLKLARGHYDLVEFSHSGFDRTFYLVNNSETVTFDSQEYTPYSFGIVLTSKKELIGASILLSNIDRQLEQQLVKALQYANEDITCTHYQVTIERAPSGSLTVGQVANARIFKLSPPTVTKEAIQAGLILKNSFPYNIGRLTFNPTDYPNVNL